MQKIKDILTPGDHHNTATGTTTGTAYNAGTAYNTDPAYGTGTGVGTGVAGTHGVGTGVAGTHGAHGTAAHDPNHPGMMQKLKDAVTPAGHHNDVPMYANTAGTTMGAGHNVGNTYGTGMQPSGLGTADYGTGTGVGTGNTMGTGYNTAYGTGTAAHKPTMMEKVKDTLPGHHNTTTGTGAYNTDPAYGTGTANKPSMMDKVKNALPGHRHKTRYNPDGTIMRRNSNSSSSSSSDDEGRRGDAVNVRKFTEVEDRPVLKERVEQYVEHVPVEKQFVVETRPMGEKVNSSGMTIEHKGVRENIIDRVTGQPGPAPGMIERAMGAGQGTTY